MNAEMAASMKSERFLKALPYRSMSLSNSSEREIDVLTFIPRIYSAGGILSTNLTSAVLKWIPRRRSAPTPSRPAARSPRIHRMIGAKCGRRGARPTFHAHSHYGRRSPGCASFQPEIVNSASGHNRPARISSHRRTGKLRSAHGLKGGNRHFDHLPVWLACRELLQGEAGKRISRPLAAAMVDPFLRTLLGKARCS